VAESKVYAPMTVKSREGNFGEEFRISFNAERLQAFIAQHTNKSGYVNLQMTRRRETGRFGETHNVTLDTWEPSRPASHEPPSADDIKF